MAQERRYQLLSEGTNRQIEALLEELHIPGDTRPLFAQLLTTVLKMYEDGADLGDLKIANSALKEMRYAFKVFSRYRETPKVTVFGSARTPTHSPISQQAMQFAASMVKGEWMVVTGAGGGVMGAAQQGAGRESGFGLNIRLPFEQEVNPWIAEDPKLINFKYFFVRKLFLLKEAHATCLFPGGFGTCDEAFEVLTLMQTGKSTLIPVVMVDVPGGDYWQQWEQFLRQQMVTKQLIDADDLNLFRITDNVEEATAEIFDFYRVFHSARYVDDDLVFRLKRPLPTAALLTLGEEYADILRGPLTQQRGALPVEGQEWPELWRLIVPFIRSRYGRLRSFIDAINCCPVVPNGEVPVATVPAGRESLPYTDC
jgi:uncharacterized protein (TIGR00730 family)